MDTEIAEVIWLKNLGRHAWRRLHFKRMFRVRAFDVCLTPNSGARADIPGPPLRATKREAASRRLLSQIRGGPFRPAVS